MGKLKAVLLDVDGTLIDSNDAHAQAWVELGKEAGYDIQFDHVRWLIGMGGDKVLPKLTGLSDESKEGEALKERRGEIFRERFVRQLKPFPAARELLARMREEGLALVVATSASEDDLELLLKQAGVVDLIGRTTSSDDAEESKPAPDIVEAALRKAKCRPEEAVMLGDTPYDVAAATNAGVAAIALRCGGWSDEELTGAVAIYDDAADLLAHFEASPLAG